MILNYGLWSGTCLIILSPLCFISCRFFSRVRHFFVGTWARYTLAFVRHNCRNNYVLLYLPAAKGSLDYLVHHFNKHFALTLFKSMNQKFPNQFDLIDNINAANLVNCLIISNHQLYIDWVYIWSLLSWNKVEGSLYIIMKRSLQFMPIIGPAMKVANFVFLSRNWATDQFKLRRRLMRIENFDPNYNLLIFPEGTTMSKDSVEKMNTYAKMIDSVPFKNLLFPRVTGTFATINSLSKIKGILNITFGYECKKEGFLEDIFGIWEAFGKAVIPRVAHVKLEFVPIAEIPKDKDGLSVWLKKVFSEKDKEISLLKTQNAFDEKTNQKPIRLPLSPFCSLSLYEATLTFMLCNMLYFLIAQFIF